MLTVILVGGKSRRMGQNKALMEINGKPMFQKLYDEFSALGPVKFSVDEKERFADILGDKLVDLFPGKGPLNGLISGFMQTNENAVLLIATDMPNVSLSGALLLEENLGDYDACIFGDNPLFGIYKRSCLKHAVEIINNEDGRFRNLFERIQIKHLSEYDKNMLINLNTPEDLKDYYLNLEKDE